MLRGTRNALAPRVFHQIPKILLVDDEVAIHSLLGLFLRQAGYFVEDAADGVEGLHKFKEGSWHVLITDLSMPKMGGQELAQEIRAISSGTPIILITGCTAVGICDGLFNAVLEKPFTKTNLLAEIERVIQRAFHRVHTATS